MKKSILFVVTYLNTGGIIRALQNFLNCYDIERYQVDVFAMVHHGLFLGRLNNCTVLPKNRWIEASVAHYENQHGWSKVESAFLKMLNKASRYRFQRVLFRRVGEKMTQKKHYVAVIGFSEGVPSLMVSLMNHPNKIGWIHCDYANYLKVGSGRLEDNIYNALHSVVCVSNYTLQSFVGIYPWLKSNTYAICNIVDDNMMREKAKESMMEPFDEDCFNIVSVGRIDPVKRLSIVPELARKVVDAGSKLHWYVIGPKGSDEEMKRLLDNRAYYGMEDTVILLGEKANPYPYIAKADLLVNTSVSEACPYVINEAKILGTPVVCPNFGSAKEFIEYGKEGFFEQIEHIADRIIWLIEHPKEQARIRENLRNFRFDNNLILKNIYSLLD